MIIDKLLSLNINFINNFGILLVFLATFLESSPVIGMFIPGSIIIFIAGFLSKLGFLNYWAILFFSISGAILGDVGSYLFGRYFGKEFLHKYGKYFLIKKEYIEMSCKIVNSHIGKSLVIGRLNPMTRTAAPFIVGAQKTSFWKFMFFNIIGGILWGFLFVSLGYILGHSYLIAMDIEKILLVAVVLIIALLYLTYVRRLIVEKISNKICRIVKK